MILILHHKFLVVRVTDAIIQVDLIVVGLPDLLLAGVILKLTMDRHLLGSALQVVIFDKIAG